jgi:hypothetical protein
MDHSTWPNAKVLTGDCSKQVLTGDCRKQVFSTSYIVPIKNKVSQALYAHMNKKKDEIKST